MTFTRSRSYLLVLLIGALVAPLWAAELPAVRPAAVGMEADTLAQIPVQLKELVAKQRIAGAVTLTLRHGKVVEFDAVGMADLENKRTMRKDSVFWIASMTKPIVATSVMLLVHEGKLSLDEPASRFIPAFKQVKLRNGQTPAREITVRDLLSHTAGLAQPNRQPHDMSQSLANYTSYLLRNPLNFEPGSQYEYGFGLTIAGRIVEAVSGLPYAQFLEERLFKPLGMKNSTFWPNADQRRRMAKTYKQDEQKRLAPAICHFLTPDETIRPEPEPSGGLFSTAQDYATFLQMIANGGEWNGVRLLSKQAVDEMTRPHVINGQPLGYGLGWAQVRRPANAPGLSGFGHGGAFSTNGLIDPQRGLVTVLMIQRTLFDNGGDVLNTFQDLVFKAVK